MSRSAPRLGVIGIAVALVACGGGGNGDITLTPGSGPPGTQLSWSPGCAGFEGFVAGSGAFVAFELDGASEGLEFVDSGSSVAVPQLEPGVYTVTVTCADPVGEIGSAEFTVT